jgi:hypothetical protein
MCRDGNILNLIKIKKNVIIYQCLFIYVIIIIY